ncbi:hypothetical protein A6723_024175 [Pseudomonas sp. AU11447]|uniref:hypothetical protein n=1 Tax=Pseudomonas sp. AU11447 TaxID=1843184 RepID=UPI0007ED5DD5|nr:hypothetical protein [Pseudomonas sp. AU11447]OBY91157.1 hypothetical protein A6723_024175 [Pseudomonas sp. AU11447]
MRKRLTQGDYEAMAKAAEELESLCANDARREMNKALQQYYRALAMRKPVAAGVQMETRATESV